jgi:hypothetical protein
VMEAAIKPLLGILVLSGILSINAHEGIGDKCEKKYNHCDRVCERGHPYSARNLRRCSQKCEQRFRKCLRQPHVPGIIERAIEPYPYDLHPYLRPYDDPERGWGKGRSRGKGWRHYHPHP